MKKILVVLLVLAVAGGVSAQSGDWNLSGKAVIGTHVDFDPTHGDDTFIKQYDGWYNGLDKAAVVNGSHYNSWDPMFGELDVAYVGLEGLKAYVNFAAKVKDDKGLAAGIEFYGDRYAFKAESQINKLLTGGGGVDALWGYYELLQGIIHLEAAYRSRWADFWTSDQTAGIVDAYGDRPWKYKFVIFQDPWDGKNTWGRVDGHDFLLANLVFNNLEIGMKVPVLFEPAGEKFNTKVDDVEFQWARSPFLLVEESLKESVAGIKFTMEVVDFAAQFYMRDYGVYFGATAHTGPVNLGLSFMGLLGEKDEDGNTVGMTMKFGGKVDYGTEVFNAYISGFYALASVTNGAISATQIGIEPGFFFNVIPSYFRFQTDVGFYFYGKKVGGAKEDLGADAVVWAVRPQIFWNFLGTGATNFDGIGTGMVIRYKLVSGNRNNELDAIFKWSF